MPRRARSIVGGYVYHVLNRANGRLRLFRKPADFAAFERVIDEAFIRIWPQRDANAGYACAPQSNPAKNNTCNWPALVLCSCRFALSLFGNSIPSIAAAAQAPCAKLTEFRTTRASARA